MKKLILFISPLVGSLLLAQSPGGVSSGLQLWLPPSSYTGGTSWTDISGNGRNATKTGTVPNTMMYNFQSIPSNLSNVNYFSVPHNAALDANGGAISVFTVGLAGGTYGPLVAKTSNSAWDTGWILATADSQASVGYTTGDWTGVGVANVAKQAGFSTTIPYIASGFGNGAATNVVSISNNANTEATNTSTKTTSATRLTIGYDGYSFGLGGGSIAEVIVYNTYLTPIQKTQVQSYLGLKYGITLSQATPQSYIASNGTTKMWDNTATDASVYNNNIAGIGRDNNSSLNQKQSNSVNTGTQIVIAAGTLAADNISNTSTLADMNFLSWGDNNLSKKYSVPTTAPSGNRSNSRMAAIWKAQSTAGFTNTVTVALPGTASLYPVYLVRSTDAVFDASDTWVQATPVTVGGVSYLQVPNVDFSAGGQYFTFASRLGSPGGVVANLRVWLKANDGFGTALWTDKSGVGNDFTQTNATRQPTLLAADTKHNFNPSADFGTTTDGRFMVVPSGQPYTANGVTGSGSSVFLMINPKDFSIGFHDYFGFGGTTTTAGLTNANLPVYTNYTAAGAMDLYPYTVSNLSRIVGQTQIPDYSYTVGSAMTYGLDGKNQAGSVTSAGNSLTANGAILGSQPELSAADIGEVIAFERELTPLEKLQVRSYMALKYGVTLDQTTPQSYLASDGTTKMWDNTATNASVYNKNIAGVGADDNSDLSQKQSNSVNAGTQVVIAAGTFVADNASNSSSLTNNEFLSWGDNGLGKAYNTSITAPAGNLSNARMPAIWKVQRTSGFANTVTVALPSGTPKNPVYLVRSTDAVFDATDTWVPMSVATVGGISYVQVPNVDFSTGGEYFTFATNFATPGGVSADIRVWLKANDGFTPATWTDNSGIGNDFTQTNATRQPQTWTADPSHNFNPSVNFMGATPLDPVGAKFMVVPSGQPYSADGTVNNSMFLMVNSKNLLTGYNDYFGFGATTPGSGLIQANLPVFTSNPTASPVTLYPYNENTGLWRFDNQTYLPDYSYTVGGKISYGQNGKNFLGTAVTLAGYSLTASGAVLGSQPEVSAGDIGEVIGYERELSAAEKQRVRSYLALKYGVTLDQGTAQSYITSDGTSKMWDHTAANASTYNNNIAGIGTDVGSALSQKQSNSVNTGAQVVIAAGAFVASNAANSSVIPNMQFLTWGDNGLAKAYSTLITPPAGMSANARMNAIWKVQRTAGFAQTTTVAYPAPASASQTMYMVRSADEIFDATDTWIPMTTVTVGGINYVQTPGTVDFSTGGQFFTFASLVGTPGGVAGALWFRADKGLTPASSGTVTSWVDQAQGFSATALGTATAPSVLNGASVRTNTAAAQGFYNFNPTVNFTAATQSLGNLTNNWLGSDDADVAMVTQNLAGTRIYGTNTSAILTGGTSFDSPGLNTTQLLGRNPANNMVLNTAVNYNPVPNAANATNSNNISYFDFSYNGGTGSTFNQFLNGGPTGGNSTASPFYYGKFGYIFGCNACGTGALGDDAGFTGTMAEFIVLPKVGTATERQQVNSYLAIKYGSTLVQPQNYLASDGTTITWNSSTNATYNNNIFGIAKDNATILDQMVSNSTSVNNNSILTIATANDFVSPNTGRTALGQDKTFLVLGDNNITLLPLLPYLPAQNSIIQRKWLAQRTNVTGSTWIQVNLSTYTSILPADTVFMLVADDAAFTTNVQYVAATSFSGGRAVFNYSFPANKYVTFGKGFIPPSYCTKDPVAGTPNGFTKIGITGQTILQPNWPGNVPNGFLALESKNKGFVITRTTSSSILLPVEGMLIFDTTDKCYKLYNGTTWNCISRSCND